ncbi:MAG: hypothetical protein MHM6MM_001506 [Cercozoa sp. M6MM]
MSAAEFKAAGVAAFKQKDWEAAVKAFGEAIKLEPTNHAFYSNRCACLTEMGKLDEAIADADKCIELKQDWAKGYSRKGLALFRKGDFGAAADVYEAGLQVAPGDRALTEGLAACEREMRNVFGQAGKDPLAQFMTPEAIMGAVMSNPVMASRYSSDAEYKNKIDALVQSPSQLPSQVGNDPDMQELFGAVLQAQLHNFQQQQPQPAETTATEPEKPAAEPKQAEPEPEAEPSEAEQAKLKGTEYYRKRRFDEALKQYTLAHELEPQNAVYINNRAAVLVQMGRLDEADEACLDVIEKLREAGVAVEPKDLGRALARRAKIAELRGDFEGALELYERSYLEHKDEKLTRQTLKLKRQLRQKQAEAYLDPAKAEEHKKQGNKLMLDGKYPAAIEQYSEAIKRDPKNHKLYTNRAAAYSKVMDWGKAMDDCDEAIKLEPTWVKAYIRKGRILHFLNMLIDAVECYDKGLQVEPQNRELLEDRSKTLMTAQQRRAEGKITDQEREAAAQHPKSQDQSAMMRAMRQPAMAKKLEILMLAGII